MRRPGGRRSSVMSAGESGAAGRLPPSPRLGGAEVALLGQNGYGRAMCLGRNGSGWQLMFQRYQMRGPYFHQP